MMNLRLRVQSWKVLLLFIQLLLTTGVFVVTAQDSLAPRVLGEKDLLTILRNYHPVIRQAVLDVERAKALKTVARGGFDPVISSDADRKRLGGNLYYDYYRADLTIPTWYGIEVMTGIENTLGSRVNPEASIGDYSYLGISVPLLRDFVMDKRRAALKQASLFVDISRSERDIIVNDLLFEAISSYWEWVRAYQVFQIASNAVRANEERLRFVKLEYLQGNRPAIDTTEALAQLQQFYSMRIAARLEFLNAGITLSAFLWNKQEQPYLLPEDIIPDRVNSFAPAITPLPGLEDVLQTARISHPKLIALQWKQDVLEIERRLKFQGLLPALDLKANLLNKGYQVTKGLNAALMENNYKFGFDFRLPLRLSEGRGNYRETRWKISQTNLELQRQQQLVENKVKSYYNDAVFLRQQIVVNESALENYKRLLNGENARFTIGESSLFLINSRELRYIEAQQKLAELRAKFFKSYAGIQWASGQFR